MKRFLIVIVVLALIFGGVGYSQGWFNYDAEAKSLSFSDKFRGDMSKIADKTKSLAKSAGAKMKSLGRKITGSDTAKEVDGTVTAVDTAANTLTLDVEGETDLVLPYLAGGEELEGMVGKMVTVTVETNDDGSVLSDIKEKK